MSLILKIYRLRPEHIRRSDGTTLKIDGLIDSFPFDGKWQEKIEQKHGGGDYRVQLVNGDIVVKRREIKIAGAPKVYPVKQKCDCPMTIIMSTGCQNINHE